MMLLVEKLEKGPSDIFSFNWNNFIFPATHLWFVLCELSADEGEQNNILGTDNCDTNDTIVTSEVIGNQIFDSNIKVRLWTVIWKIRVLGAATVSWSLIIIDWVSQDCIVVSQVCSVHWYRKYLIHVHSQHTMKSHNHLEKSHKCSSSNIWSSASHVSSKSSIKSWLSPV